MQSVDDGAQAKGVSGEEEQVRRRRRRRKEKKRNERNERRSIEEEEEKGKNSNVIYSTKLSKPKKPWLIYIKTADRR
jgi:hypothetical protein